MAIVFAAGRSVAVEGLTVAVVRRMEVTASVVAIVIFARRPECAVVVAMAPIVFAADFAVETVVISRECIALVVAIDILRESVAGQPSKYHTTSDCAAVAVTDSSTNKTTGNRAKDCAGHFIATTAIILIIAFMVVSIVGRRRSIIAIISSVMADTARSK